MANKKTMNQLFGRNVVKQSKPDNFWPLPGELIGLEIETENFSDAHVAQHQLQRWWTTHSDASLRQGVEWVLSTPLAGTDLREAVEAFFSGGYSYDMSERTSIHIHINASDSMSVDQFRNVFTLMYLIEPAVFRWADENRKWCGYCQPLTDMSPQRVSSLLLDEDSGSAIVQAVTGSGNSDRYYGLNIAAFQRHGTLEFRYFPCTDDGGAVTDWIKFVMQVKRAAITFDNPLDILSQLDDHRNIDSFLTQWFDDNAPVLQRGLDYSDVVKRSKNLQALVTTQLKDIIGSPMYRAGTATTRGFTKLLNKKFGVTAREGGRRGATYATTAAANQSRTSDVWAAFRSYSEASGTERNQRLEELYNALRYNGVNTLNSTGQ